MAIITQEIKMKTWEDNLSWEDCLLPTEKEIIKDIILPEETKCLYFGLADNIFMYCSKCLGPKPGEKPTGPNDPVYQRKINVEEAQMWCVGNGEEGPNYERCSFFKGELKR